MGIFIYITKLGIVASYEHHLTSNSSTERSIPPMFTKCLVSSLSCASEYFSAFSFESKNLSTTCWLVFLAYSFPCLAILYLINSSHQRCLAIIMAYD